MNAMQNITADKLQDLSKEAIQQRLDSINSQGLTAQVIDGRTDKPVNINTELVLVAKEDAIIYAGCAPVFKNIDLENGWLVLEVIKST